MLPGLLRASVCAACPTWPCAASVHRCVGSGLLDLAWRSAASPGMTARVRPCVQCLLLVGSACSRSPARLLPPCWPGRTCSARTAPAPGRGAHGRRRAPCELPLAGLRPSLAPPRAALLCAPPVAAPCGRPLPLRKNKQKGNPILPTKQTEQIKSNHE